MIWRENPDGKKRTIEEAKEIAQKFGVHIPDDVEFFEDEEDELPENLTARGPKVTKLSGSIVYWSIRINTLTGKVPFLVRPDILKSDEAIVGVFGHEMHELEALRGLLKEGKTPIEHFHRHHFWQITQAIFTMRHGIMRTIWLRK